MPNYLSHPPPHTNRPQTVPWRSRIPARLFHWKLSHPSESSGEPAARREPHLLSQKYAVRQIEGRRPNCLTCLPNTCLVSGNNPPKSWHYEQMHGRTFTARDTLVRGRRDRIRLHRTVCIDTVNFVDDGVHDAQSERLTDVFTLTWREMSFALTDERGQP